MKKGQFQLHDITGNKYGNLTVIKILGRRKRNGITYSYRWLCECICGRTIDICASDLKCKRRKNHSCGCLKNKLISDSRKLPEGESAFNLLYKRYSISCAKSRDLTFNLDKELFKKIVISDCFYCNKSPKQIVRNRESKFIYNGIDRVDNSVGYIESNVVSCCKKCNTIKGSITIDIAKKMLGFLNEKL